MQASLITRGDDKVEKVDENVPKFYIPVLHIKIAVLRCFYGY